MLQGGERDAMTRAGLDGRPETGLPEPDEQIAFCHAAAEAGISGLLTDFGATKPDPIVLAAGLAHATRDVEFIVAYRSGASSPTIFTQQINTLSALLNGQVSLNIVAGHSPSEQAFYGDFLPHDERYARTGEFLTICNALWDGGGPVSFAGKYYTVEEAELNTPYVSPDRTGPYLFIAGGSRAARDLAVSQGSCWMRLGDAPDKVAESIQPVLAAGKDAGLRLAVVCRESRAEALEAARVLVGEAYAPAREQKQEKNFVAGSDSVSIAKTFELAQEEWLTPVLWTGAVRSYGAPALALVGGYQDVADAILEYQQAGVTEFILSGWPKQGEMERFGRNVMPLLVG